MQEYEVEFKSTTHRAYRVKAPSRKFAEEYAIEHELSLEDFSMLEVSKKDVENKIREITKNKKDLN